MSEGIEGARTHAPAREAASAGPQASPGTSDAARPTAASTLLRLQRLAGNRAVVELLARGGPMPDGALSAGAYKFGRHPQFPRAMGQTYYARKDIEIWPSFNLDISRSWVPPFDYEAKPKQTDAAGNAWPVLATPENENGYKMPDEHPSHPGKEYWIRVSSVAAEKIVAAEAQHVADLDEGWNLTGFAAKKAINQAAADSPATGDSPAAAKAAAVNKTVGLMGALGTKIKGALEAGGRLEDALGPMMDNAFTQSKTKRDDSGKHHIGTTYVTTGEEDRTDETGSTRRVDKVLYEADPDAKADPQATSEVVNLGAIGG